MTDKYRATINGFTCHNETWDDPWQKDGKRDEVYFSVHTKIVGRDGTVKRQLTSESDVMGDTNNQPGRVRAGSASDRGGIRTGDRFPETERPWEHGGALDGQRHPPFVIWEGELVPGGDIVMLTPTLCVHREVDWQQIGHANGVVAMAATNGRLFCATSDNRLWTRDPVAAELNWTDIGHANGVVGMTALDGR